MKKKKLKKKIKELEDQLVGMYNAHDKILRNLRDRISALDNEICSLGKQVDILRQRTETDYTQFRPLVDTSKGPNDAPPTCETCRWNKLENLFTDSPCFGCTKEDKKMYEPITHTEEPNGQ